VKSAGTLPEGTAESTRVNEGEIGNLKQLQENQARGSCESIGRGQRYKRS